VVRPRFGGAVGEGAASATEEELSVRQESGGNCRGRGHVVTSDADNTGSAAPDPTPTLLSAVRVVDPVEELPEGLQSLFTGRHDLGSVVAV